MGAIELKITEPCSQYHLSVFKSPEMFSLCASSLIEKYSQQLQSSIYYYEFYDGIKEEIENTDIVDVMMSELVLEYHQKMDKKILGEYMLIKSMSRSICTGDI